VTLGDDNNSNDNDDDNDGDKEMADDDNSDTDTDADSEAEIDAAVRDKVRSALGDAAAHSDVEVLPYFLINVVYIITWPF